MEATYAQNNNKVLELPGADFVDLGLWKNSVIEGLPVGVIRDTDFVRFGRGSIVDGVDIDETYTEGRSGDLYVGADGYPVKDPELRIIADPNPDWTAAIRNSLTVFGGLELSALVDIRHGGDVVNGTRGALYFYGTHKDTEDRSDTQVFEGEGPGKGTVVSKGEEWYRDGLGNLFEGPTVQWIEDGGFVKLREIAAAYTFTGPTVLRLGLSSVRFQISAQNLKTWTDYSGIDPETSLHDTSNMRGTDYFNNPNTRSYALTVEFN